MKRSRDSFGVYLAIGLILVGSLASCTTTQTVVTSDGQTVQVETFSFWKTFWLWFAIGALISAAAEDSGDTYTTTSCFPEDVDVLTPSGYKPISSMQEGDPVLSWDAHQGALVEEQVIKVLGHGLAPVSAVEFSDSDKLLRGTGNHRVLMESGEWRQIDALEPGDRVVSGENGILDVEGVSCGGEVESVYNLLTTGQHNFVVDGVVVHNFDRMRVLQSWFVRSFVEPLCSTEARPSARVGDFRLGAELPNLSTAPVLHR